MKSEDRVRDAAEVFTAPREVEAMLDLIPAPAGSSPKSLHLDWRILEPSCGHGNFLEAILIRKLRHLPRPDGIAERQQIALRAVASTYGIDIAEDNIAEARRRLTAVVDSFVDTPNAAPDAAFRCALDLVLATNIVRGDGLTGHHIDDDDPTDEILADRFDADGNIIARRVLLRALRGIERTPFSLTRWELTQRGDGPSLIGTRYSYADMLAAGSGPCAPLREPPALVLLPGFELVQTAASASNISTDTALAVAPALTANNPISSPISSLASDRFAFDVIIGNPPYQESRAGTSDAQIYHLFIKAAIEHAPRYVSMITSSRWFAGGRRLEEFRPWMLADGRLRRLVHYPNGREAFRETRIEGGVSYWLWDRDHTGATTYHEIHDGVPTEPGVIEPNRYDILVRFPQAYAILDKIEAVEGGRLGAPVADGGVASLEHRFSPQKPFGLLTNFSGGTTEPFDGAVTVHCRGEIRYVTADVITRNAAWLPAPKVLLSKAYGYSKRATCHQVIGRPIVARAADGPSACTQTYLVAGVFDTDEQAQRYADYLQTRLARFLIYLRKPTQDIKPNTFAWVPDLPMDQTWTDEDLYERYGFDETDVAFIESVVRDMLPPGVVRRRSWTRLRPAGVEAPSAVSF